MIIEKCQRTLVDQEILRRIFISQLIIPCCRIAFSLDSILSHIINKNFLQNYDCDLENSAQQVANQCEAGTIPKDRGQNSELTSAQSNGTLIFSESDCRVQNFFFGRTRPLSHVIHSSKSCFSFPIEDLLIPFLLIYYTVWS